MCNVLPAITFVMPCILRLEEVNLKNIRSEAKVIVTITTVAGAMLMTLVKGPILELFWTKGRNNSNVASNGVDPHHSLKGAIIITVGCFSWSCFMLLQAIRLKSHPAELSLTAWICLLGTAEGAIVALVIERGNSAVWAFKHLVQIKQSKKLYIQDLEKYQNTDDALGADDALGYCVN